MIPLFKVHLPRSVDKPLLETVHSGFVGQGARVEEFERGLEAFLGSTRVLTLNSCTSAIHLALHLSGLTYGRTAVSTPMTCTATNEPILALGGHVAWCDIDPHTGNLDHTKLTRLLAETPKVAAVVCVAWAGYPCEFDEIHAICREHGVKLIVDAAHGFGMEYHGARVFGDFTCFSFQAIKHITTFDGGALWCRDEEDYARGKLLRWYGIDRSSPKTALRCEDPIAEAGYKFHMNDVSATVGIEQLRYLEGILERHRQNALFYDRIIPMVYPAGGVTRLRYKHADRNPAYWIYTCRHSRRDEIVAYLADQGIAANRVHIRNDLHPCFEQYRVYLPGVEQFDSMQFSIPCGWWLKQNELEYIADTVSMAHERIGANVEQAE